MERLPRPRPTPGQASPPPAVGDRSAQHLQARGNGRDRPRLSQHRPPEQPGRRGSRRPRRRSRRSGRGGRPHPPSDRLTRREPKNNKDDPMKTVQKRILVTGGAGFLGSHLCERLSARGHDILCADNYFTGRKDNIAHLLQEPNFESMRHDITFPLYVEVDEIYNLACPASPVHYQHDPVQTTKTSVIGAINMLGLAKRLHARILQASTSEVYGDPDVHPQTEEYRGHVNLAGPRGCYDEGKRCAETLFYDYKRQHRLSIRVARIFNTYGPNMHPQDGRVVSSFIIQALKNEPITIYGSGSQTRSFCYVDDLVDGLTRLMNVEGDLDGPVNLGNP